MIRDYAPIGLIPAAWAMTFATMIYPGISTYWIQHMHYFMVIFLSGFTLASWREMEETLLDIWRKVIAGGVFFTALGALSFHLPQYSTVLGFISLGYWFLAPGIALYRSSEHMEENSELYRKLGGESIVAFALLCLGIYSGVVLLQIISIVGIAALQTASIAVASKMDKGW